MTIPAWSDAWQDMFRRLERMRETWPTRGWEWDSRFGCCTSSFATAQEAAARAAAALALPTEWASATIGQAPQPLQDLVARAGGVRTGQRVLSQGPLDGLTAYGLWWPWGNGKTVSLRIGLADVDPGVEPFLKFRNLFGVTI
jgi:hypothetical protein